MAFTAAELDSIFNAALDFYLDKDKVHAQTIQDKPLLDYFERNKTSFPGGKENISVAVKGDFGAGGTNDGLAGYTHDDQVEFYTPANIKRANFPWKEMHLGIEMTFTELKIDGLSVVDTGMPGETSTHPSRDMTVLAGLFKDKLHDFSERYARSANDLMWGDGTSDAKAMAGIKSIMRANPLSGTVGGLDASQTAYSWWRNRARTADYATALGASEGPLGGGKITSSTANGGALIQVMQHDWRQLRRYGGARNIKVFAGSDFIDALETEMRANGTYSDRGFTGKQDPAMGEVYFKGSPIEYDPSLDDLGEAKFCYVIDVDAIKLCAMSGEWKRKHTPPRPHDRFVLRRSITNTGQMICKRRNSSQIFEIN